MILNAPWLHLQPRKKFYNKPAIRSEEATLEIRATREWKMFYSQPRKSEHDGKYIK